MEDAFSLFDFERRPLVDQAVLKERYLRLAADRHPDASGGADERFHSLQEAYKTLREPAARLRHLLALEFPASGKNSSPATDATLFLSAGNAIQAARAIFRRLEGTSSVLARALLSLEIAAALQQIRDAHKAVTRAHAELVTRLENLDSRWPGVSPSEVADLASSFRFLARWTSQLSEWEFRLSNG